MRERVRVQIVSDGTAKGTSVYVGGKEMENCVQVSFGVSAKGVAWAELVLEGGIDVQFETTMEEVTDVSEESQGDPSDRGDDALQPSVQVLPESESPAQEGAHVLDDLRKGDEAGKALLRGGDAG